METAQELMKLIFNAALVVMIMATMFGAGLSTTLSALGGVFKNVKLLILVLLAALIVRPLVGWGTAAALSLATPAFIAMLLLAACPGAPFGAKLVMTSRGDVVTGASLQVLLAAMRRLRAEHHGGTTLTMVGSDFHGSPYGPAFAREMEQSDLQEAVNFVGHVPYGEELFRQYDAHDRNPSTDGWSLPQQERLDFG